MNDNSDGQGPSGLTATHGGTYGAAAGVTPRTLEPSRYARMYLAGVSPHRTRRRPIERVEHPRAPISVEHLDSSEALSRPRNGHAKAV